MGEVEMKVMLVHVKYRLKGGEDAVFENEVKLLQDHGYDVIPVLFSNDEINTRGIINKILLAVNTVWSIKYYKFMSQLLAKEKPDVVHFHNIFPLLSPSVYKACYDNKIPVVQTLHNYRWGCPAATFYRGGSVCELCMTDGLINSVKYGCYRNSRSATLVVAAMIIFSKWRSVFDRYVTKIIVLTQFAKNKMTEAHLPAAKIIVKPNFSFIEEGGVVSKSDNNEVYALFIGRLSDEKGIKFLAETLIDIPESLCIKVAGDGPDFESIKKLIAIKNLNMELLGSLDRSALTNVIMKSSLVVIPSQWYEGFPMVILDAYSHAKPVLISNIGGLPELVVPGVTGHVFDVGNNNSLKNKLIDMMADQDKLRIMGKNAYQKYKEEFSADNNLTRLKDVYDEVVGGY